MNRIKELRLKSQKTLDDMAIETRINRETINNYENGNTEPSLEDWFKLAMYFDVSMDYLTGFIDVRKLTPGKINRIRRDLKLSQSNFGKLFNPPADRSIVSRWELGKTNPSEKRREMLYRLIVKGGE